MNKFASDCNVSCQDLYDKVASVTNEARDCYEASTLDGLDDASFFHMMCLDGCFILWFLYMVTSNELEIKRILNIDVISHVRRDLILLENQIPWVILHSLMSFTTNKKDVVEWIIEFQDNRPHPRDQNDSLNELRESRYEHARKLLVSLDRPIHLLNLIRSVSLGQPDGVSETVPTSMEWSSFRSTKELKAVGINFRMATHLGFSHVSFENNLPFFGTLVLLPLCVDYRTKSKLLNMAAYEACPDASSSMEVTSYIYFMKKLLDEVDDVKVLRSDTILFNQIGSHQLVADIFNGIDKYLVPNPKIYVGVRKQIEDHYKNKYFVWVAQWKHKYLTTSWAIFGLLVGIVITGLAAIQTWFTVFPRHN